MGVIHPLKEGRWYCEWYLASIGETTVGGIIAGSTIVSLVSVFVLGKKAQRKSLEE